MNQQQNFDPNFEKTVYEIFDFLKENMVTREEAKNFATKDDLKNFTTKEDFAKFRSEIITHVDQFVQLHQTLDQELIFLRHRQDTLETRVQKLESQFSVA